MINIHLNNIGKRYNYEWIFRKVNYDFTSGNRYVILGANGSGKSTLLQIIAGNFIPSEGEIKYQQIKSKKQDALPNINNVNYISEENIFQHLSYAAPYLDLFEEFTLVESIEFQAQFKPFFNGLTTKEIVSLIQLEKAENKQLKYYSSGMKQRVRLALAILANTPLLLLDEPASNLDKKAIDWYQLLVAKFSKDRLIIVCSNQQDYEYSFCNKQLIIAEGLVV